MHRCREKAMGRRLTVIQYSGGLRRIHAVYSGRRYVQCRNATTF